ncbi:hypothetical protein AXYL_06632 (plasmid) [Achromobacter xylosoxidans A8]|uniref:Uncharacterized protein n=1 Tax=Achromobacter xylosoxidans (strain A8) TaxID=762376 RepID=E3HXW3_ACHXA|nr:hypothetical protein AXYL_06632 [Achromobacter xylosoxidans A8]
MTAGLWRPDRSMHKDIEWVVRQLLNKRPSVIGLHE